MDSSRTARLLVFLTVFLALVPTTPSEARKEPLEPPVRHFWTEWVRAVSPWMSEPEREAFEALDDDLARERFLRAFWSARGEEELRRWSETRREALRRFEEPDDPRVRAWTLAGPPSDRYRSDCRGGFGPIEAWRWSADRLSGHLGRETSDDLVALFYRDRLPFASKIVWWSPEDGVGQLTEPVLPTATPEDVATRARRYRCFPSRRASALFERALRGGAGPERAFDRLAAAPRDPSWTATWTPSATGGAALSATRFEVDFPGRYQTRTILEGRFRLPIEVLERTSSGRIFETLRAVGEVRRDGRLLDAFRTTWWIVGAPPRRGFVEISLFRRVLPGTVDLEIRLEDGLGRALWRGSRSVEVPRLEEEAAPPPGTGRGFGQLARPEVATLVTLPTIDLLPLPPPPHVGALEVAVSTSGGPVDRVRFSLDGATVAEDVEPPWLAEIDVGPEPENRRLEAEALDRRGRVLDRTEARLLAAPEELVVRLEKTPTGDVTVFVDGPTERPWSRVRLQLDGSTVNERTNETGTARVQYTVTLPPVQTPAAVVDAEVVDQAGERAEATLVVGRAPTERIDVRLVELEATVVDRDGHPVTGLPAEVFRVFENDAPVPLTGFSRTVDRPLDLALLVDLSSSMRPRLRGLERAARDFVRSVLTPADRASLVTFDHEVRRRTGFTDRPGEILSVLDHLWAEGSTRLHDALWFTLASFEVPDRRRALVLLSDGQDVDSDLDLSAVHEAAVRSGVAIYAILLDIEHEETRLGLEVLAAATGGRAFSVLNSSRLGEIYRRIEKELRSRYLLVVESASGPPGLRRVRVEVDVEGLRARSRTAYLP